MQDKGKKIEKSNGKVQHARLSELSSLFDRGFMELAAEPRSFHFSVAQSGAALPFFGYLTGSQACKRDNTVCVCVITVNVGGNACVFVAK